jgi:hypothetical protein
VGNNSDLNPKPNAGSRVADSSAAGSKAGSANAKADAHNKVAKVQAGVRAETKSRQHGANLNVHHIRRVAVANKLQDKAETAGAISVHR